MEFRNIYKPGNPSRSSDRAYLFYILLMTTTNFIEIQRSMLWIKIICEILQFYVLNVWKYTFGFNCKALLLPFATVLRNCISHQLY